MATATTPKKRPPKRPPRQTALPPTRPPRATGGPVPAFWGRVMVKGGTA
jgi:hypothetical protein